MHEDMHLVIVCGELTVDSFTVCVKLILILEVNGLIDRSIRHRYTIKGDIRMAKGKITADNRGIVTR